MTGFTRQQRAAITKRNNTRSAFLGAADTAFANVDYSSVLVEQVASHAALSTATFYSMFSGKSAWGAAVLDRRLGEALDQQAADETGLPPTTHARLLGHFGLLADTAAPLPGITGALTEERVRQEAYRSLLPRYYGEITQALVAGQEQQVVRNDASPTSLADFALDSIALAYAIHLDDPADTAMTVSLVLDGLHAKT